MKIVSIAVLLVGYSLSGSADTESKIDQMLLIESSNLLYIYPEGGVTNPPNCHGSNGDYISYSMSRPLAKEYLSLLMMAFAAQKTVLLNTANACTDQAVSETLEYVKVMN